MQECFQYRLHLGPRETSLLWLSPAIPSSRKTKQSCSLAVLLLREQMRLHLTSAFEANTCCRTQQPRLLMCRNGLQSMLFLHATSTAGYYVLNQFRSKGNTLSVKRNVILKVQSHYWRIFFGRCPLSGLYLDVSDFTFG